MKTVQLSMKSNRGDWYSNGEWLMIDDIEDLYNHLKITKDTTYKELVKLYKSDLPVERWDHYRPTTDAGAISLAVALSKIDGVNPIYKVDSCLAEISNNKVESFIKYGNILLNKVGGYCHYDPSFMKIEHVKDYKPSDKISKLKVIKEGTDYLNLENDPELELYTKDFLKHTNFSYITCLREFSEEDLEKAMREFVSKGGHTLWMYTTGSDVEQMYDYSKIALKCGILEFSFYFNSGENEHILEFLTWLDGKSRSLDYEFV